MQEIKQKAAALHNVMPRSFTRIMENDCQKTMKKIGKYTNVYALLYSKNTIK